MKSFSLTFTEETICDNLVFSRQDVEDACKLFTDNNPVHCRDKDEELIIPSGLVAGRAEGRLMDWAIKNGLVDKLAVVKDKRVSPKIRAKINHPYRIIIRYKKANPDQKEKKREMKIKMFIVSVGIDIKYPTYEIDFTIIYR